ncbi:MAG: gamma-glutamyltransferase, partial [Candidatus Kapabacteria bacterium]|nr:gamma-glutamyltransferase [Candidatus Kapabacteria bacterium]
MYPIVIRSFLKKIFPYSFLTCKHALLVLSGFALICISGMMQAQTGVLAKKAMVVTAHPEATDVGIRILQKGGNAVDAAVAVQFALAVVYPNAGNIGGGGFMVYRNAKGETATLDFREKAPLKATRNMYLDTAGDPITDLSLSGALAVGVPGTVDGMVKAHERFGVLPWKDVV